MWFTTYLLLFTFISNYGIVLGKNIICNFLSWNQDASDDARFTAQDLNPFYCTHYIYLYSHINQDYEMDFGDLRTDLANDGFKNLLSLREKNSKVKFLLDVRGSSTRFSSLVGSIENRNKFVKSVVSFLTKYQFDGIQVNWLWPGVGQKETGLKDDKSNLISLLKELRIVFDAHRFTLAIHLPGRLEYIDTGYDVPSVSKYSDLLILLTVNYYYGKRDAVGHNAPLYSRPSDLNQTFNVNSTVQHLLQRGADPQKLNIGVLFYAEVHQLSNPKNCTPGSAALGPGAKAGKIFSGNGFLHFHEFCHELHRNGTEYHWDDYWKSPYLCRDGEWMTFENKRSIQHKLDYIIDHKLGGIEIWAPQFDDYNNTCGNGRYPLMKLISQTLLPSNSILRIQIGSYTRNYATAAVVLTIVIIALFAVYIAKSPSQGQVGERMRLQ